MTTRSSSSSSTVVFDDGATDAENTLPFPQESDHWIQLFTNNKKLLKNVNANANDKDKDKNGGSNSDGLSLAQKQEKQQHEPLMIQNLEELKTQFRSDLLTMAMNKNDTTYTRMDDGTALALWSCIVGYCEALTTNKDRSKRYQIYPIPYGAIKKQLIETEFYQKLVLHVVNRQESDRDNTMSSPTVSSSSSSSSLSLLKAASVQTYHRTVVQSVANAVWDTAVNKMQGTSSTSNDELHANNVYVCLRGYIDGKSLDCFGAAVTTIAAVNIILQHQQRERKREHEHAREEQHKQNKGVGTSKNPFSPSSVWYQTKSMLTLSEDHAYERHTVEPMERQDDTNTNTTIQQQQHQTEKKKETRITGTCEVAISGRMKRNKQQRGCEIAATFREKRNAKILHPDTSWLYMAKIPPVVCDTVLMTIVPIIGNINCTIRSRKKTKSNNSTSNSNSNSNINTPTTNQNKSLECRKLYELKCELLWVLYDLNAMKKFPYGLMELADCEQTLYHSHPEEEEETTNKNHSQQQQQQQQQQQRGSEEINLVQLSLLSSSLKQQQQHCCYSELYSLCKELYCVDSTTTHLIVPVSADNDDINSNSSSINHINSTVDACCIMNEVLLLEAIAISKKYYNDRQVYPYYYLGHYHKDAGKTKLLQISSLSLPSSKTNVTGGSTAATAAAAVTTINNHNNDRKEDNMNHDTNDNKNNNDDPEYRFVLAMKLYVEAVRVTATYRYDIDDCAQLNKHITTVTQYIYEDIISQVQQKHRHQQQNHYYRDHQTDINNSSSSQNCNFWTTKQYGVLFYYWLLKYIDLLFYWEEQTLKQNDVGGVHTNNPHYIEILQLKHKFSFLKLLLHPIFADDNDKNTKANNGCDDDEKNNESTRSYSTSMDSGTIQKVAVNKLFMEQEKYKNNNNNSNDIHRKKKQRIATTAVMLSSSSSSIATIGESSSSLSSPLNISNAGSPIRSKRMHSLVTNKFINNNFKIVDTDMNIILDDDANDILCDDNSTCKEHGKGLIKRQRRSRRR